MNILKERLHVFVKNSMAASLGGQERLIRHLALIGIISE